MMEEEVMTWGAIGLFFIFCWLVVIADYLDELYEKKKAQKKKLEEELRYARKIYRQVVKKRKIYKLSPREINRMRRKR
jgi:hypothetical protein